MNAAEMATIGETENAFVQLESNVHVRAGFAHVGAFQQFFAIREPQKLAIEFEMHGQEATVQSEENIFSFAADDSNAAALRLVGDMRSRLRFRGDGVKDVDTADSPALDEGPQRANDSFHFREFRHGRSNGVRSQA